MAWPPRSPDVTPLDFYLFGYMKERINGKPVNTINELKASIEETARFIRNNPEGLETVMKSNRKRIAACLRNNGDHFEHDL